MAEVETHVVTGAFGFSGKYIASQLLEEGRGVRTLTDSLSRENPFKGRVEAQPFHFDDQPALIKSMEGASVLYNTYWVRFNHKTFSHAMAVVNTLKLFHAAKKAGVGRVVHVSITNPSKDSPLEYFRCKAQIEKALVDSGLSYAILRPALLFGREDILLNNIAWALRKFPVFGVFGDGLYRVRPIYVGDLAKLAVEQGRVKENAVVDAVGPQVLTYRGLVEEIAEIIGKKRTIVSVPSSLGFLASKMLGFFVHDAVLTRDEIIGLTSELLYTDAPSAGSVRLSEWAKEHGETLGVRYASELARRRDREKGYESL
jgi:uncharacterized protein YbjT (DUF2867 family)